MSDIKDVVKKSYSYEFTPFNQVFSHFEPKERDHIYVLLNMYNDLRERQRAHAGASLKYTNALHWVLVLLKGLEDIDPEEEFEDVED